MNKLSKFTFLTKLPLFFSKILCGLVCLIICLWGVFNAFQPMIVGRLAMIQLGSADTWLSNYLLEHSFQLLVNTNYAGELWSPPFFFPYQGAIAFSENFWGSAPVYWLLRFFSEPDAAFQLWLIAVSVLCFLSFFILSRSFGIHPILGSLGSFLFAFGMPRIQQISHPQILPQFFTPLAFLSLWNFTRLPTSRNLFLVLTFIYLQTLSSIYLGWFLVFSFIIFAFIVYGFESQARRSLGRYIRKNYKSALALLVAWSALMLALFRPYLQVKEQLGDRSYAEVDSMLPRLASWLLPADGSFWWQTLQSSKTTLPMYWEHPLFLGFVFLGLIGFTVYINLYQKQIFSGNRAKLIRVCLLVALAIFILSFRLPNGWSLWRLVYEIVPGATAIRAVTRIWTVFYFYLLIGLLLSLDSYLSQLRSKQIQWAILSLICISVIAEQTMLQLAATPKSGKLNEIAEIQSLLTPNCDVAYVEPDPRQPLDTHISAMWAGLKANIPVVNGYSGNWPPGYPGGHSDAGTVYDIAEWLQGTKMKQVCVIVPQPRQALSHPLLTAVNAASGQSSQNFASWSFQLPFSQHQKFAQAIQVFEVPQSAQPEETIAVPVVVKNSSNFIWRSQGKTPTNFSYHWLDAKGQPMKLEGHRTPIPADLPPGKSVAINATITMPTNPGEYKLVATMVQEDVAWFDSQGAQAPSFTIKVQSANSPSP